MARQLRVSPTTGEQELIKILAQGWGKSEAEVVMEGWRKNLPRQMAEFENFQRLRRVNPEFHPLRLLLIRMASGEDVPDSELALIEHDIDVPLELLTRLRDCLSGEQRKDHVHAD